MGKRGNLGSGRSERRQVKNKKVTNILKKLERQGKISYGDLAEELNDVGIDKIDKVFQSFKNKGLIINNDLDDVINNSQKKVENVYLKIIDEAKNSSLNGNFITDLNKYNLNEKEEKILLDMLKTDDKILDLDFDKNKKEINLVIGLDYCKNLNLGTDEDEESEEDEL